MTQAELEQILERADRVAELRSRLDRARRLEAEAAEDAGIDAAVPEVVSGVRVLEAQQAWRDWSPVAWQMIKLRGLLIEPCAHDGRIHVRPARKRSLWHVLQSLYERSGQARAKMNTPEVSVQEL